MGCLAICKQAKKLYGEARRSVFLDSRRQTCKDAELRKVLLHWKWKLREALARTVRRGNKVANDYCAGGKGQSNWSEDQEPAESSLHVGWVMASGSDFLSVPILADLMGEQTFLKLVSGLWLALISNLFGIENPRTRQFSLWNAVASDFRIPPSSKTSQVPHSFLQTVSTQKQVL